MDAGVADIAEVQGHVAHEFPLHGQVPLPAVWHYGRRILRAARRDCRIGERRRRIERPYLRRVDDEWRIECLLFVEAHGFALEKLADACTDCGLAISPRIPGDAETRRNGVIVVVYQGAVRSRSTR